MGYVKENVMNCQAIDILVPGLIAVEACILSLLSGHLRMLVIPEYLQ